LICVTLVVMMYWRILCWYDVNRVMVCDRM